MKKKHLKIIIISDGTGETAASISRAVMTQFPEKEISFTRFKNVSSSQQVTEIFNEAAIHHDLIIYTIVDKNLREHIANFSRKKRIRSLDALGPALTIFSNYFDQEPSSRPGLLHAVNDEYFNRVEAMEFTQNHDDGKNLKSLHLADIILIGVSRTSKTPLSIFLSFRGYKVMNIPLTINIDPPKEIFTIDQRKIFALTIDHHALQKIRRNRQEKDKKSCDNYSYADDKNIIAEINWANHFFNQNKRWPVINVAHKALEDTAFEIIKLVDMRKKNSYKHQKSNKDN